MRTLLSVRVFVSAARCCSGSRSWRRRCGPPAARARRQCGFGVVSNGFAEEFCANQGSLTNSPNSPKSRTTSATSMQPPRNSSARRRSPTAWGQFSTPRAVGTVTWSPILGGSSQIVEKRAGRWDGNAFFDHPGGSLIHDRATDPRSRNSVRDGHNVTAFRASLSVLGLGFVEAINSNTLDDIRSNQPSSVRGQLIEVPVLEAPGKTRAGRFGWKNQQASLVSFSADAYVNEMGITSPLQPDEPTSNGDSVERQAPAPSPRSGSRRRRRGRGAVCAVHAIDAGSAA